MIIYSLDILLFLFGTSLLFHVQFFLLLPDLHICFSRGRSGSLLFPSLSEFSTVYLLTIYLYNSYIYTYTTMWTLINRSLLFSVIYCHVICCCCLCCNDGICSYFLEIRKVIISFSSLSESTLWPVWLPVLGTSTPVSIFMLSRRIASSPPPSFSSSFSESSRSPHESSIRYPIWAVPGVHSTES